MSDDARIRLGALLTRAEASGLANWLESGSTLSKALNSLSPERRTVVKSLLIEAELTGADAIGVLRAIEGVHSQSGSVEPIWTVPGAKSGYGHLTSSVKNLVLSARASVVCSAYNFQKSSALWAALAEVAGRGTVDVTVYLDAKAATLPTAAEVATQLAGARVFQTRPVGGKAVRNHAKFIALDHQVLIVTSANFSVSAEKYNVEFGLVLRDAALAGLVTKQLFDLQPVLYERVYPGGTHA